MWLLLACAGDPQDTADTELELFPTVDSGEAEHDGEWPGRIEVDLDVSSDKDPCRGEGTLSRGDDDAVTGEAVCTTPMSDLTWVFAGQLVDGVVTGTVSVETELDQHEMPFEGTAVPHEMSLTWSGQMTTPDGGSAEIEGAFISP